MDQIKIGKFIASCRKEQGMTQAVLAEKLGISDRAISKWETGATVPDIEKCLSLAEVYGTTIDSLIRTESVEGLGIIPPAPRGKNIWGSVAVGERGQIVIPKGARDLFGLTGGQRMVVLSDENGIALIPEEVFMSNMRNAMERSLKKQD